MIAYVYLVWLLILPALRVLVSGWQSISSGGATLFC